MVYRCETTVAHIMLVEAESKRDVGGGLIIQSPKRLLRCQAAVRALSIVYIYTFRLFLSSSPLIAFYDNLVSCTSEKLSLPWDTNPLYPYRSWLLPLC